MKQIICLLILLIGVLNTHGTPIHIGIGAGGSLSGGLENLPSSIVSGGEAIVNEIIGSGSSSTSEASVPAEASEPSSVAAESSEPSAPAEVPGSSSAEPSETSAPAEATEASSVAAESSSVSAATATPVPPEPSEASSASSIPAEASPPPAPTSSSTDSPAPAEPTVEVTSEPESSTNSTVSESPESTTPASENPNTCLGSCPAVDSYDSVYLVNERCDKFCQCTNGRAVVLSCPDGLHFNRVLNVCDWPVNAKCARVAVLNK